MIVLILFCRFAMTTSGPELNLEFLIKRKDNVEVPKGIDTPMCFCGDKCKLVRCTNVESCQRHWLPQTHHLA
jgi:hypothetical protein